MTTPPRLPAIADAELPDRVPCPHLTDLPVTSPDDTVTGLLSLRFLRSRQVWVATTSPLVHRDTHRFDINLLARRAPDGLWDLALGPGAVKYHPVGRRQRPEPSWSLAVKHAVRATLTAHWTPDLDRLATRADAIESLHALRQRAQALLVELDGLDTEADRHWAHLRADNPTPGTPTTR